MNRRKFCQVLEGLFRGITGSITPLDGSPEEDVDKWLEEAGYSVPDVSEEYKQIIDNKEFSIRIFGEVGDREKIKGAFEYLKKANDINKEVFTNLDKVKTFYRNLDKVKTFYRKDTGRFAMANTTDPSYRPRIIYINRSILGGMSAKTVAGIFYHETTHISGHNDEIVPYLNKLKFELTVC